MKLSGINNIESLSYSGRLLKEDIVRLPSPQTNKADFYTTSKENKSDHKSHFWRNVFTALTFGITGLYIAHRNNLFNPARKEAKRIVKTDEVINRIRTFVQSAVNPETYKKSAQKTLGILAEDKSRGESFSKEAHRILGDNPTLDELYNKLFIKPKSVLIDDKNQERYISGYTVDVLDRLAIKIEKMLGRMKQEGQNIKDQGATILNKLFEKDEKGVTIVEDTLLDVIGTRSSAAIENFVQDSIIASKIGTK